MICYYSGGKGMIWLNPYKNKVTIHFRKGKYPIKYKKLKLNGWGGYPEITIKNQDIDNTGLMKYLIQLIKISYSHE